MRRLLVLAAVLCLFTLSLVGQTQPERRVIEVSGSAEQLIIPNEFTFKITLAERMEGKRKITIEDQEASLRDGLSKLGIDVSKDLSVFDISSQYLRQKKLKDVIGTKDYRLKVTDLNKIAQLQDLADRINIAKLDLTSTDNSEMQKYRRETKIAAMKAARDKASYLLAAIGSTLGKPVFIRETDEESTFVIDGQEVTNFRTGALNSNNNLPAQYVGSAGGGLSFSPVKIRYVITARFEIE